MVDEYVYADRLINFELDQIDLGKRPKLPNLTMEKHQNIAMPPDGLRIIRAMVVGKEVTAREVADAAGLTTQTVSGQLRTLERMGLICRVLTYKNPYHTRWSYIRTNKKLRKLSVKNVK